MSATLKLAAKVKRRRYADGGDVDDMPAGVGVDTLQGTSGQDLSAPFTAAASGVANWYNQPSWADRAQQQTQQDTEAYLRGGPKELMADTGSTQDLMGGFVGSTLPEAKAASTFYSPVRQAVEAAKTETAPSQQWLATLRNTPGVKGEELEHLGLNDAFGGQGPVTKQQLLDHIDENQVQLGEVVKGRPDPDLIAKQIDKEYDDFYYKEGRMPTAPERQEILDNYMQSVEESPEDYPGFNQAKFAQYQLPGGENYRERLLTLPPEKGELEAKSTELYNRPFDTLPPKYQAIVSNEVENKFKTSHWDEPNVLAHYRANDRVINGEPTMFLEELQSDWHQAGRKKGYVQRYRPKDLTPPDPNSEFLNRPGNVTAENNWFVVSPDNMFQISKSKAPTWEDAKQYVLREKTTNDSGTIPDAPFKKTWPDLLLKRAIREAVDNGQTQIAWTPGDVQAARYDLSKHVNLLSVMKQGDKYLTYIEGKDGQPLFSRRNGFSDHGQKMMTSQELEDTVGKDIAKKAMEGKPNKDGWVDIRDQNLKIGGEGMKGFYDQILPTIANKLGKKYGAKVEQGSLGGQGKDTLDSIAKELGYGGWHSQLTAIQRARINSVFDERKTTGGKQLPVHVLKITPALARAAKMQGFPQFATGGAVASPLDKHIDKHVDRAPTEAQKEAGNYRKAHVRIHGLDIAIENAKGSFRHGKEKNGKPWKVQMQNHYGYIKRTEGADGDHVDVYIGNHLQSPKVYIVHQHDAESGKFDEHKCFLGFASKAQVVAAYHKAFSDGKAAQRLGKIEEMSIDKFKEWLDGDTTKRAAGGAVHDPRIKRDAFLYLEPKNKAKANDFAQCGECRFFDRKTRMCAPIAIPVKAEWSCDIFLEGPYDGTPVKQSITADEAGLVKRQVRCENCKFGGTDCGLYLRLNRMAPELFDLETKIHPKACCNANTPKTARAAGGRIAMQEGGGLSDSDIGLPAAPPAQGMSDADIGLPKGGMSDADIGLGGAQQPTSLVSKALEPLTSYPATYEQMNKESREQMAHGVEQMTGPESTLWDIAKGAGNVALGGAGYLWSPVNALSHTVVGKPVTENLTPVIGPTAANVVGQTAEGLSTLALPMKLPTRSAPRLPPAEPFGITRTVGERTGDLGVRAEEAGAMRSGEPYAAEFVAQRRAQIDQAQDAMLRGLDPYAGSVVGTPTEAGELTSSAIRSEAARTKKTASDLYTSAKAMPGEIHAGAFEGMPQKIKGDLSLGDNPVIIDDTTPQASKMINYLDGQIAKLKIQNKADPFGPPNPENIVGVNLAGVDQWRKNLSAMRRDAFSSSPPGQVNADARATQKILDAFDEHVGAAVNDPNLFSGDKNAVGAWNSARQAYSDYRKTFTAGRNDPVGRVMQKIIGDPINDPLTPTKVIDQIVGTTGVSPSSTNIGVAKRIKSVLGEQSPEWIGVKQGTLQKLIQPGEGEAEFGTARQAQNLSKFLNGDMANVMYSPQEVATLRSYANLMRDLTMPPGTYAPSEPAIRRLGQALAQRVGGIIGATMGYMASPFPILGELAGYTLGKQAEVIIQRRFSSLRNNFPIVGQAMKDWSKAQSRIAAQPQNIMARRAAVGATANLQRALNPLGVKLESLMQGMGQGTVPAGAEQNQQQQ